MAKYYYLDTCIWLNLFKKERNADGNIDYHKIVMDFLDTIMKYEDSQIIISSPILKELKHKAGDKFDMINEFLNKEEVLLIATLDSDFRSARKIESDNHYQISFFDCLHIAFSKRFDAILVTRDRKLIEIGRRYIFVSRPEDLMPEFSI
jgi:predicted nucleic acid-binding protein